MSFTIIRQMICIYFVGITIQKTQHGKRGEGW